MARSIATIAIVGAVSWPGAHAQGALDSIESLSEAFTVLSTSETIRKGVVSDRVPTRLMKWNRPIVWTAIGMSSSRLGGPLWPALHSRTSMIAMLTERRAHFEYAVPKVVRPSGGTFDASETTINRLPSASVTLSFEGGDAAKAIVATYESPSTFVVAKANLLILTGDSSLLIKIVQDIGHTATDPLSALELKTARCASLTWAGTDRQGMLNGMILIDDQVSMLDLGPCLFRPLARILGIRGEIFGRRSSAFSSETIGEVAGGGWFDMGMISMLFDPEFESGMKAAEVAPITTRLVPKYFRGKYR